MCTATKVKDIYITLFPLEAELITHFSGDIWAAETLLKYILPRQIYSCYFLLSSSHDRYIIKIINQYYVLWDSEIVNVIAD